MKVGRAGTGEENAQGPGHGEFGREGRVRRKANESRAHRWGKAERTEGGSERQRKIKTRWGDGEGHPGVGRDRGRKEKSSVRLPRPGPCDLGPERPWSETQAPEGLRLPQALVLLLLPACGSCGLPSSDRRGSAVLGTEPHPWVATGRQGTSWAPGRAALARRRGSPSLLLSGCGRLARLHGWCR